MEKTKESALFRMAGEEISLTSTIYLYLGILRERGLIILVGVGLTNRLIRIVVIIRLDLGRDG